mmetsp:Transcript_119377/g.207811  ORF Transcript_119377/g.207811 Transcript_119377/m.207811 type:complete len:222 (+) Transcript_119377:652-1317(+)
MLFTMLRILVVDLLFTFLFILQPICIGHRVALIRVILRCVVLDGVKVQSRLRYLLPPKGTGLASRLIWEHVPVRVPFRGPWSIGQGRPLPAGVAPPRVLDGHRRQDQAPHPVAGQRTPPETLDDHRRGPLDHQQLPCGHVASGARGGQLPERRVLRLQLGAHQVAAGHLLDLDCHALPEQLVCLVHFVLFNLRGFVRPPAEGGEDLQLVGVDLPLEVELAP